MPKFLCIQRSQPQDSSKAQPPSPSDMEAMYAKFNAWQETFKDRIVDMGGRLAGGKVVTCDAITDGPFVEVKEVVGGFMLLETDTIDEATEVVQALPGLSPGASIEVRLINTP